MSAKIKILHIVTGLGMGGAERVVLDLASRINHELFDTHVIALSSRIEMLCEFEKCNVNTTVLSGSNSFIGFIRMCVKIVNFIRDNKIDLIHAHMTHSIIVASIVKIFKPSVKIVYTSHSLNIGSKIREIIVYFIRPLRSVDIIFSQDAHFFYHKKAHCVIPNGVDVDKYDLTIKKHDIFTFVSIGRLESVKNHLFLIEIANKLRHNFDFKMQIIGEGSLRSEMIKLIKKYQLDKYVDLLGVRRDIPRILNEAHCFLMPSLWEGFPISILEAGASCLPIVATPVGSVPVLLDVHNSYISDLDSFESKMIEILNNYEEAKEKGVRLFHEIKRNYSIQNVVSQHELQYFKLI